MRCLMTCLVALCLTSTGCMMETMDPDDPALSEEYEDWDLAPVSPDESDDEGALPGRHHTMTLDEDEFFAPAPPDDDPDQKGEKADPFEPIDHEVTPLERAGRPEPVPWKGDGPSKTATEDRSTEPR